MGTLLLQELAFLFFITGNSKKLCKNVSMCLYEFTVSGKNIGLIILDALTPHLTPNVMSVTAPCVLILECMLTSSCSLTMDIGGTMHHL